MEKSLLVQPGSLTDDSDDLITSCSIKDLAGNRHRLKLTITSQLDSEVTVQTFLQAKNCEIEGYRKVNRANGNSAVRLSNLEPGEENTVELLLRGKDPVIEYFSDYRGYDGKTGGRSEIIGVDLDES